MSTSGRKTHVPDQLPPHSAEAEQGVLGCIMLDPKTGIDECVSRLRHGPASFYDLRLRTVYEVLLAMDDAGKPLDLITVAQELKDRSQLEAVGGLSHISSLADSVPSAANLPYYLEVLDKKATLRKVMRLGSGMAVSAMAPDADPGALVARLQQEAMEVDGKTVVDKPAKELVVEAVDHIERLYGSNGMPGRATGLLDFDKLTGGLMPGEVTVFAGYPGMGKTALACTVCDHMAVDLGMAVRVFSMEMSAVSWVARLISLRSRVNLQRVREGFIGDAELARISSASSQIMGAKCLVVDDHAGLTITEIRSRCRHQKNRDGLDVVMLDYVQLVEGEGTNRQEQVASVSRGIRGLAKELQVPVILLCQLNDEGKARESRAIEQDADTFGVLESAKGEKDEPDKGTPVDLNVRKQRNGPTGRVPLVFLKQFTRMESASKVSAEDVPADDAPFN